MAHPDTNESFSYLKYGTIAVVVAALFASILFFQPELFIWAQASIAELIAPYVVSAYLDVLATGLVLTFSGFVVVAAAEVLSFSLSLCTNFINYFSSNKLDEELGAEASDAEAPDAEELDAEELDAEALRVAEELRAADARRANAIVHQSPVFSEVNHTPTARIRQEMFRRIPYSEQSNLRRFLLCQMQPMPLMPLMICDRKPDSAQVGAPAECRQLTM